MLVQHVEDGRRLLSTKQCDGIHTSLEQGTQHRRILRTGMVGGGEQQCVALSGQRAFHGLHQGGKR